MKTYNEIINQAPLYLHNWRGKADLIEDFEHICMTGNECNSNNNEKISKVKDKYKNANVLFAFYGDTPAFGEDAYAEAWVLFEQNGRLFEVYSVEDPCYGLEKQWEPEEVTLETLERRLSDKIFGENDWPVCEFEDEITEFLGLN